MKNEIEPEAEIEVTSELLSFRMAMQDVRILATNYTQRRRALGRDRSTAGMNLTVFNRAAIQLCVTALETFLEDSIKRSALQLIERSNDPLNTPGFLGLAHSWLSAPDRRPKDLAAWTGDGWKRLLKARLKKQLDELHSPHPTAIANLSKTYLGLDLTQNWHWARATSKRVSERLTELIALRGSVAHRSPNLRDRQSPVTEAQVAGAILLVENIVLCTMRALRTEAKEFDPARRKWRRTAFKLAGSPDSLFRIVRT